MSFLASVKQRAGRLARMVFAEASYRIMGLLGLVTPGFGTIRREVGDGLSSSTVTAPLFWIARTFPEAPPALWSVDTRTGKETQVFDHPMLRLLQRPNDFFTGVNFWMATLIDYKTDGNAYWLVVRNTLGRPLQLWWAPHWMIEPKGTATTFITHYEYRTPSVTKEIRPEDVIHFRFAADPDDPRLGIAPLKSVLREVFTDDEAARFTAALLRNMGVPGIIVSPDGDEPPTADDVKLTKAYIREMFSGERRGEPLVLSGKTKVDQFGFSPEELTMRELRRIPEERVTAVMGVPAIVAGLGAGLDRSTFTNYNEAREAAYEESIIPTQRALAEEIRFQLLPSFEGRDSEWRFRFGFDLSKVRVLQTDEVRRLEKLSMGVRDGWVQVAEPREHAGLDVTDADRVYLRPMNAQTIVAGELPPAPADRPEANGSQAREIAEEVVREAARRA